MAPVVGTFDDFSVLGIQQVNAQVPADARVVSVALSPGDATA